MSSSGQPTLFEKQTNGFNVVKKQTDYIFTSKSKKKIMLVAIPSNLTAKSFNGATMNGQKLTLCDGQTFACDTFGSMSNLRVVVTQGDKTTSFTPADQSIGIRKCLNGESTTSKQSFLPTQPPPTMPTGLKVRYQPFGALRGSELAEAKLQSAHSVFQSENEGPPTKKQRKEPKSKKKDKKKKTKQQVSEVAEAEPMESSINVEPEPEVEPITASKKQKKEHKSKNKDKKRKKDKKEKKEKSKNKARVE